MSKDQQVSDQESLTLDKNIPKFQDDPKAEKEDFAKEIASDLEQVTPEGWRKLEKNLKESKTSKEIKKSLNPSSKDKKSSKK